MPGTSRHHWGTDIDINSVKKKYFQSQKGKLVYQWLQKNAHLYGFFQVYEKNRGGYHVEEWHWSYLPISLYYLYYYNIYISYEDIKDFNFDYLAEDLEVIQNYVNVINPVGKQILKKEKN